MVQTVQLIFSKSCRRIILQVALTEIKIFSCELERYIGALCTRHRLARVILLDLIIDYFTDSNSQTKISWQLFSKFIYSVYSWLLEKFIIMGILMPVKQVERELKTKSIEKFYQITSILFVNPWAKQEPSYSLQ